MARVFVLGPRIGKVNVRGTEGALGQEIIQYITRLDAQQAQVGEVDALAVFAELADAAKQSFDAQKIALGMTLGVLEEKSAVAAADLQLGRLRRNKKFLQAKRLGNGLEIVQQRVRIAHAFSFFTKSAREAV